MIARVHELLQGWTLILVRASSSMNAKPVSCHAIFNCSTRAGFAKPPRQFSWERVARHELHRSPTGPSANDAVEFEHAGVALQTKTRRAVRFSSGLRPSKSSIAIVALCDEMRVIAEGQRHRLAIEHRVQLPGASGA